MRINFLFPVLIVFFVCTVALPAKELTLHGSRIAAKILVTPYKQAFEKKTGFDVKIEEKTCGKGLCDLIEGKCDASLTVGDLNATIESARMWGKDIEAKTLQYHPLVNDKIVFFVNYFNIVDKLSSAQIRDILTGKITNWKEVGGDDAPIQVYLDVTTGPVYSAIKASLFENKDLVLNCMRKSSIDVTIEHVIKGKNAISAAPVDYIDPAKVQIIEMDTNIELAMGMITVGQAPEKVQKLLNIVSSEIQRMRAMLGHQTFKRLAFFRTDNQATSSRQE